jgi:5-methyltetrahydrofolate--homocysteine methyltransferase
MQLAGGDLVMSVRDIFDAILAFDEARTARQVQAALDQGMDVMVILNEGLIAAMDEVGRRYAQGVFFVPEMLMTARAMKKGMSVLRPRLERAGTGHKGCVVIGTVEGDQHDIGKNLVAMMLECAGFRVIDLGKDVAPERFVKTAKQSRADIVAMSALITSTLAAMANAVSKIRSERNPPKTLVGGAPVTQEFAERIGADGFSPDAVGAVAVARRLIRMPQEESM